MTDLVMKIKRKEYLLLIQENEAFKKENELLIRENETLRKEIEKKTEKKGANK